MASTSRKLTRKEEINLLEKEYAHGQEELRAVPNIPRSIKKPEMTKSKSNQSSSLNSSSNLLSLDNTATTTPGTLSSTLKLRQPSSFPLTHWSPMDDGITVSLPGSTDNPATTAAVDEHINNILYGPTTRKKRLSVFCDICPE